MLFEQPVVVIRVSLRGLKDSLQPKGYQKIHLAKKRAGTGRFRSQLSRFYALHHVNSDSSGDYVGGDGNSGVRWTSSMMAQSSSCSTDTVDSSQNSRRMDSSRIGTLDSHIRPRLLRRQP